MDKLFKIKAAITINKVGGGSSPITNRYRPGFNFIGKTQTSGSINLLGREALNPGEQATVEISFVSSELLGDIKPGVLFKFYEGPIEIGSGKVDKVIGWVDNPHTGQNR